MNSYIRYPFRLAAALAVAIGLSASAESSPEPTVTTPGIPTSRKVTTYVVEGAADRRFGSRLDSIEAKLDAIASILASDTEKTDTVVMVPSEPAAPDAPRTLPLVPGRLVAQVPETAAAPAKTDTILPFTRGIEQTAFIPKGQWIGGVSVSYSQSNQDRYQFLIIENLSGDTYTFKVSPMVMFAFKNNLAAGARFAYSRSRTSLKSADIVLDSETGYNVDNLYSINHSYVGTFAFRQYMSLGGSTRFGFFNEVQMQLGGGQSKICTGTGVDVTGTYSTNFTLDVGLAPGLIMFLSNYSALEVNVGVLGFNYTKNHFITDQIYPANMRHSSANFKINLFSITFGVAFYI